MRRFDKITNINKVNILAEQRYFESKGLLKENNEQKIIDGVNVKDDINTILNSYEKVTITLEGEWELIKRFDSSPEISSTTSLVLYPYYIRNNYRTERVFEFEKQSDAVNAFMTKIKYYRNVFIKKNIDRAVDIEYKVNFY